MTTLALFILQPTKISVDLAVQIILNECIETTHTYGRFSTKSSEIYRYFDKYLIKF